MQEKRCTKCKVVKPADCFMKDARHSDGLQSHCNDCRRITKKAYYYANREHDLQKSREWQRKNKDKVAQKIREGYEKYPERHIARTAVNYAVKMGKLPRVTTLVCSSCGVKQARQYHHYLGYEKEHRLDVVPLCMDCHKD